MIELNELYKVTKAFCWLQTASHKQHAHLSSVPLGLSKHRIVGLVNVFIYYVYKVHRMDCVKLVCVFFFLPSRIICYSPWLLRVCSSAGGLIHLSSPGPSGPLLFNTCPEPCSLRTVLSSLCGEQLFCARPLGFSYGNGPNCSSQPQQCTGHLLPPAGVYPLLFNFCSKNKVAENRLSQFIHTEIGWICISSQNNPEIWLHSIPNPWKEQFFSWLPAK